MYVSRADLEGLVGMAYQGWKKIDRVHSIDVCAGRGFTPLLQLWHKHIGVTYSNNDLLVIRV